MRARVRTQQWTCSPALLHFRPSHSGCHTPKHPSHVLSTLSIAATRPRVRLGVVAPAARMDYGRGKSEEIFMTCLFSAIKPTRSQLRHEEKEFRRLSRQASRKWQQVSPRLAILGARWLDARSGRPRGGVNFIDCHTDELLCLDK